LTKFNRTFTAEKGSPKFQKLPQKINGPIFKKIAQTEASFLTTGLPPGVKFAPRDELCPLGRMFTPPFTPRGELHSSVYKNGGANKEIHPQGITSPLGDKIHS
jgi:hypothetical protein